MKTDHKKDRQYQKISSWVLITQHIKLLLNSFRSLDVTTKLNSFYYGQAFVAIRNCIGYCNVLQIVLELK